jgi:hypothetical protein
MTTSLRSALAVLAVLAIEPFTNAADELSLHGVEPHVVLRDDQDVLLAPTLAFGGLDIHGLGLHATKGRWVTWFRTFHDRPPPTICMNAAEKPTTTMTRFDKGADAIGALKHPSSLCVYAYARREPVLSKVGCVMDRIFEIFFMGVFSHSSL